MPEPGPTHACDPMLRTGSEVQRHRIHLHGLVQGVGFRPFVYRLARELQLQGWVRNGGQGVEIEAEGTAAQLDAFLRRLGAEAPAGARIDGIQAEVLRPARQGGGFVILDSLDGATRLAIGPDLGVCDECLCELFDPRDRRYGYPFLNCTRCGPRYTITRSLPYDRARTSLAPFPLCADCRREYEDPADRRFHAEAIACPACGPRLRLLGHDGAALVVEDPVAAAARQLRLGAVLAVKGLGGFHLVCDADNAVAIATLRARKARAAKPLAAMVANLASAHDRAILTESEAAWLAAPERPIVLVRPRPDSTTPLPGIAPGMAWIGLMLPSTPLHHLLFHRLAGSPEGMEWLDRPQRDMLVCTSANPGGEPLVMQDAEAVERLAGIADGFLVHDRDILHRCDDTVLRAAGGGHAVLIRRARGLAPNPIRLARAGPAVLAFGAHLKNALCLTRGDAAFFSPHIGDLDTPASRQALDEAARELPALVGVRPQAVAHDLHPDFPSTRAALELATRLDLPAIGVQHHHAHIAAVLAEHRCTRPALGLALDGVGLGSDGTAWGGELLRVEGADCHRLGHLQPLPLPGGDRAAREPWRMAAAALHRLGQGGTIETRYGDRPGTRVLRQMLERNLHCPPTTSLGRWFDAAAGLLGVCPVMDYEGQAAMLLESLATRHGPVEASRDDWRIESGCLDLLPLLAQLAGETDPARGAARFHVAVVEALSAWVAQAAEATGIRTLALGGGCLLNRLLAEGLRNRLQPQGLTVLEARLAPPNDGGLALGQAWVAQCRLVEREAGQG